MGITLNVEQYLKDLEYLVNIDSQSKDPEGVAKVAAFFEKAFGDIGWTVERVVFDPTAGPSLKITNGEPPYDALLLGHLDTVFPKGTVAERPFSRDEKRAYGPGVNDMKSGLLFGLYAARATAGEQGVVPPHNSEEETASRARPDRAAGAGEPHLHSNRPSQRQPDERRKGLDASR